MKAVASVLRVWGVRRTGLFGPTALGVREPKGVGRGV